MQDLEGPITAKAEQVRAKFRVLLAKTNKENPRPRDVKDLSDLLSDNRRLELWRGKQRLQMLKKDLGSDGAPGLEQLLIQHAALCWLRLTLAELAYSSVMKGSITLTLGMYMEKRLTTAQKRFTRACETLTRVRKISRNTPALQVNIAASGGQQVNVSQ